MDQERLLIGQYIANERLGKLKAERWEDPRSIWICPMQSGVDEGKRLRYHSYTHSYLQHHEHISFDFTYTEVD